MSNNKNTPVILLGAVAAVAAASLLYYALAVRKQESAAFKPSKPDDDKDDQHSTTTSRSVETSDSSRTTPTKGAAPPVDTDQTPLVKNGGKSKQLHARIEELDKQGKAFFKAKQVRICWLGLQLYYIEGRKRVAEALLLASQGPVDLWQHVCPMPIILLLSVSLSLSHGLCITCPAPHFSSISLWKRRSVLPRLWI
jgi:hypothetical protein